MVKRRHTMYVHADKESNYFEATDELHLSEEAAMNYRYTLLEVAVDVVIDDETGNVEVIAFKYNDERFGLV